MDALKGTESFEAPNKDAEKYAFRNSVSLILEGGFNTLASDMISLTSIVPMFLNIFGVRLTVIGSITTFRTVFQVVMPLILGIFVCRLKSKKKYNIVLNGIFRPTILIISVMLLCRIPGTMIVPVFLIILILFLLNQSSTGFTWHYLVSASIKPRNRSTVLGILLVVSGIISVFSGFIIKAILNSEVFPTDIKYALIFGMAGVCFIFSVVSLIPLKEVVYERKEFEALNVKKYVAAIGGSLKDSSFRKLVYTNMMFAIACCGNAFVYVFAQNILNVTLKVISNMIIIQVIGQVTGGVILARIPKRHGNKPILIINGSFAALLPLVLLMSYKLPAHSVLLLMAAAFCLGFEKTGNMSFKNYLMGMSKTEDFLFLSIAMSCFMFPVSSSSIIAGEIIERTSYVPVFIIQLVASVLTMLLAARIKEDKVKMES